MGQCSATMIVITNLPPQIMDENVVTIIDAWECLEALCNHLGTPLMFAYQERASDIVENVALKELQEE